MEIKELENFVLVYLGKEMKSRLLDEAIHHGVVIEEFCEQILQRHMEGLSRKEPARNKKKMAVS